MKKLPFLLILITTICFSQNYFEKGYIINNNGERIECFIKNEDWKSNPTEIAYKSNLDSESKTANLQNTSEFGIDIFFKYIRVTVDMERTTMDLNNYNYDRTPKFKTETVFLKALKESDISLYSYEENNLHLYFIKKGTNKIEQLINKPYKLDEARVDYYQYYKQQLINSLQCDGLKADIEKTGYNKSGLMEVFEKYYKCSGQTVKEISKDKGKTEIKFYVTPGVTLRSYKLERAGENATADFAAKPSARIGAEMEVILPFNHAKWALFIEPNYETYSFSKEIPTYNNVTIEEQTIYAPIGVRHYMLINKNSKLFLDLALNLFIAKNSKGNYGATDENFEVKDKNNLVCGLGYAYKKYRLEVRFDLDSTVELTSENHIQAESKAFSFIFGYNFF